LAAFIIETLAYNVRMKFGRIKRQHGRIAGLDKILDRIIKQCPYVTRIVPGRIKVRRGKTPASFRLQYSTGAGLKCLYTSTGTVQEVFLICSDKPAAEKWLAENVLSEDAGEA
jgi:hypothetical protein